MKTLRIIASVAVLVLLRNAGANAQEAGDTTNYEGAAYPVWVSIKAQNKPGQYDIGILVSWDDVKSTLPFSADLPDSDLLVRLPRTNGTAQEKHREPRRPVAGSRHGPSCILPAHPYRRPESDRWGVGLSHATVVKQASEHNSMSSIAAGDGDPPSNPLGLAWSGRREY